MTCRGTRAMSRRMKLVTGARRRMNHSTARNVYVKALMKIASEVTDLYDVSMDEKELKKIAINPEFQETIRDFMDELNYIGSDNDRCL